jgi:hypothetical protein
MSIDRVGGEMNATKTPANWLVQVESATTLGELRQIVSSAKLAFGRNEIDAKTLTALTRKFNDEMGRRQAAGNSERVVGVDPAHATSQLRHGMAAMKAVEFWCWLIPTQTQHGTKMVKTRYRMDEATALEAHPGAMKVPGTLEWRNVPDTAPTCRRTSQAPGGGRSSGTTAL